MIMYNKVGATVLLLRFATKEYSLAKTSLLVTGAFHLLFLLGVISAMSTHFSANAHQQ